jgi:hypothetical protein
MVRSGETVERPLIHASYSDVLTNQSLVYNEFETILDE